MALDTRLAALISAIGADIKALTNRVGDQHNASTAQQASFISDTYVIGSAVAIPQGKIKVGTKYKVRFNIVKGATGTNAPVLTVRVGTAGGVADTSRATLTFAAQTAVADEGEIELELAFRTAGASATFQAIASMLHRLTTTGFSINGSYTSFKATSGTFDVTGANLKIGVSLNAGATWSVDLVSAELVNLTP